MPVSLDEKPVSWKSALARQDQLNTTLLVILAGLVGAIAGFALAVLIAVQFFLPSVAAQDKVGFSMGIYIQLGPIGAVVGVVVGIAIALLLKNHYQI